METIEKAQNRFETTMDGKNGFFRGVLWSNHWIDVNEQLPPKGVEVLLKVEKIVWITTDYTVGYLKENTMDKVWIIEGRHCSHHKNAANNCVTSWRPIERL